MNPNVLKTVYAVRGELYLRAAQLQAEGKEIIFTNVGNPHSLGQKPMTFPRLVLALAEAPFLMDNHETAKLFPEDAIARAKKYLSFTTGGIGAYSDSRGLAGIRKEVAEFIAKRDGFPSDPDKIYLTDGASKGVERMLNVLIRNEKDGILCPIPQYPLYSASIALLGGTLVPYYLDESQGWGLDMAELKQSCEDARSKGIEVAMSMGEPYASSLELVSFHTVSKGTFGECGQRGGYMEIFNIDEGVSIGGGLLSHLLRDMSTCTSQNGVSQELYKMSSISLCPNLCGQLMVSHSSSFWAPEVYTDRRQSIASLLMTSVLNPLPLNPILPGAMYSFPRINLPEKALEAAKAAGKVSEFNSAHYQSIASLLSLLLPYPIPPGAMYSFPRINLPEKALEAAKAAGKAADVFYCLRLLEATGITAVPGSGFGQKEGPLPQTGAAVGRASLPISSALSTRCSFQSRNPNARRGASVVRRALSGGPNRNRDEKNDPGKVIEFSGSDDSDTEAASKEKSTGQLDDIGAELARLRQERAAAETAAKADEGIGGFWRGVVEETQMIQWPAFTSVLGTTGVVVVVIVSSGIVLLTVNALLANFSDALFELPAVREIWHL
ncbi:unnamed protein product [Closterium sp. NIES-54]